MQYKPSLLYLIILLEGYCVLSLELLAIRLTTPFVGSGTDTISIIIAAVLLPLALGYYSGGKLKFTKNEEVEKKLQSNFLISLAILCFGLGYGFLVPLFEFIIQDVGIHNRYILTLAYAIAFVIFPVYFLGQTIPIVAYYFKESKLNETAGNILFFSTLGSFLGAVATTIIFMNWIGVPLTACLTLTALFVLVFMLNKVALPPKLLACFFLFIGIFLNSSYIHKKYDLIASNAYNFIQVTEHSGKIPMRMIKLNGAFSSSVFVDKEKKDLPMAYANYIEKYYVNPIRRLGPNAKILILGAGGFTIGRHNHVSDITYVDIDPNLKDIAEKEFLKEPLGKNKTFIAQPARSYLIDTEQKFNMIILDLGKGLTGSPEHLVTREFFGQILAHIKPEGIVLAHYYVSPLMDDIYSRNLDSTLKSVFPNLSRIIVEAYNPWPEKEQKASVVYVFKNNADTYGTIYKDILNKSAIDKGGKLH